MPAVYQLPAASLPTTPTPADTSRLPHYTKGMHLVTRDVVRECEAGLKDVEVGIFTLNCLHTSAGLTVGAA